MCNPVRSDTRMRNSRIGAFLQSVILITCVTVFASCRSLDQEAVAREEFRKVYSSIQSGWEPSGGESVLNILSYDNISREEKIGLCDTLAVEAEAILSPAVLTSVPTNELPSPIAQEILKKQGKVRVLESQLVSLSGTTWEEKLRELLEEEIAISHILDRAGYPELAYAQLLLADAREYKHGRGGSESSVVMYKLMLFEEIRLLTDGICLFKVLRSQSIPLRFKERIIRDLRSAGLKGAILSLVERQEYLASHYGIKSSGNHETKE